jgi:hypothetical protein
MADKVGWYNGYSPKERMKKLNVFKKLMARGEVPPTAGPCSLCGDPDVPVEYHDEDYSEPYIWTEPASYVLCVHCHRHKLHKRFWQSAVWSVFLAHVQRGGYAREWKDPGIKKELADYAAAFKRGEPARLLPLRSYTRTIGKEWFGRLTINPASLTNPAFRPRP